ncbi:MAG: 1-acyl-sn-glycerol-3-phosphate acyltransferase [Promethearchaeota archaeon]
MAPNDSSRIPLPHLSSWMHERIPLPRESAAERVERYLAVPREYLGIQSFLSRLVMWSGIHGNPRKRWVLYRVIVGIARAVYKVVHRMEVRGRERVPPGGAIFIINHLPGPDVVTPFVLAFGEPVGVFTDAGDSYLADFLEEVFGFVIRRGRAPEMVEKMVRAIALKNRYFAMWPEGTLEREYKVMQGFSGIVRVYATVNAERDRIPFVPVVFQRWGPTGTPRLGDAPIERVTQGTVAKKGGAKKNRRAKRGGRRRSRRRPKRRGYCTFSKVAFTFLEPVFVPRGWLKPPDEGGKTPREIIDWLMLKIARTVGQTELAPNRVLERRRANPGVEWH